MSKLEDFTLPDRGFVFWPVGSGDSTTIVVDDEHVVQVDVRQLEASSEEDDPRAPVVDFLEKLLPKRDGNRIWQRLSLHTQTKIIARDSLTFRRSFNR